MTVDGQLDNIHVFVNKLEEICQFYARDAHKPRLSFSLQLREHPITFRSCEDGRWGRMQVEDVYIVRL